MILEALVTTAAIALTKNAYDKSLTPKKYAEQMSKNSAELIEIVRSKLLKQQESTQKTLDAYDATKKVVWDSDIHHFLRAFKHFRNVDDFKQVNSVSKINVTSKLSIPDIELMSVNSIDYMVGVLAANFPIISLPFLKATAERVYSEARRDHAKALECAEKIEITTDTLRNIEELAVLYNSFVCKFCTEFYRPAVKNVIRIYKDACTDQGITPVKGAVDDLDFRLLSEEQKKQLFIAYNLTDLMCGVLSTPLYNKKGEVNEKAVPLLEDCDKSLDKLVP